MTGDGRNNSGEGSVVACHPRFSILDSLGVLYKVARDVNIGNLIIVVKPIINYVIS